MVKTVIKETTKKYNGDGKLLEETIREETSEDDTVYYPSYTPPLTPLPYIIPDTEKKWEPYCTVTAQEVNNSKLVQAEENLISKGEYSYEEKWF